MRFKLDENLHADLKQLLVAAGHDAATVHEEGLQSAADTEVWAVCCHESRTLLTQDTDFSDARHYPVSKTPGIIILRGHGDTTVRMQCRLTQRVIDALPDGGSQMEHRWIVDLASIRRSG